MKFRKKPVAIEAVQWTGDLGALNATFLPPPARDTYWRERDRLVIKTLNGEVRAEVGDWIIRGVRGELYPCKPDIFEATYEAVAP